MSTSPSIDSLSDLRARVRATTLYEDSPDELPQSDLDSLIENAQLRLSNRTGSTNWYSDNGLSQALLYASAIEAKASLSNFTVTRWDIGAGEIDVSGASDTDQAQFQLWADWVAQGLSSSDSEDVASTSYPTNITSDPYMQ